MAMREVLFLFTPKDPECKTFNQYIEVDTDLTVGEIEVDVQDKLHDFLQQSGGFGPGPNEKSCDATEYYIDFHLTLD